MRMFITGCLKLKKTQSWLNHNIDIMIWIIVTILLLMVIAIIFSGNSTKKLEKKKEEESKLQEEAYAKLMQEKADRRKKAYNELTETRNEFDAEYSNSTSFEFDVVGIFYRTYEAQQEAKYLYGGKEVKLKHDKNNRHSDYAIKIIAEKYHIGFVPDDVAYEILPYLQKYKYKAIVLLSFTEFDSIKFDDVTEVTIKAYFFDK